MPPPAGSIRWRASPAISASSSTDANGRFGDRGKTGARGDEAMTKTTRRRNLRLALALTGLSVMLAACNTTGEVATTQTVPTDYRQRHPIAAQQSEKSIVIIVSQP